VDLVQNLGVGHVYMDILTTLKVDRDLNAYFLNYWDVPRQDVL
jgi:hypothetical protein